MSALRAWRVAALQRRGVVAPGSRVTGPAQRRRILVPSSLYGITTAEDRIADFRLKMMSASPRSARCQRSGDRRSPRTGRARAAFDHRQSLAPRARAASTWGSSRARVASCGCNFLMAKAVPPLVRRESGEGKSSRVPCSLRIGCAVDLRMARLAFGQWPRHLSDRVSLTAQPRRLGHQEKKGMNSCSSENDLGTDLPDIPGAADK